ncbi:MAG: SLBB domain-containing protein [Nitrospirota bacterium]
MSEFEQYTSEKIDITEKQLEILQKYGITFSQTIQPPPFYKIKIAVRVIGVPEGAETIEKTEKSMGIPIVIDAGFLMGTQEQLSTAFKILGIKGPFIITAEIKQFGYDLFRQPPSTFAPVENVPVGPDYVLGPGDEIRITVWGKIEGQWNLVVDRDGNISLPKVGILGVTGLTFRELKDILYKELSKYYTGFEMNVSMGSLRTIRIYVVGNAERPGTYTVSSLSTLINALFEAGGPNKTGTMRDIQLKRNGKTITHFDMYDFLLKGDKTKDVRLMPEDVIFISPIGPVAAIAGSVNNPAIYELKGEATISQLIEMAGGFNTVAFKGRIQIERIINNSRQVVFESNLDDIRDKSTTLQSGDVVKIFQIVQDKKIVRLSGAVQREGDYGFSSGMTAKDLILMAGGLKYYAYDKEAELTRVYVTDKGPRTEKIMINLQKALAGEQESNISLKENDYFFVRTVPEWRLYQTVTIQGKVKFPGTYTFINGERLSSLIERSGGYTDKAYLRGAVFTREGVRELQQRQIDEMVERLERDLLGTDIAEISAALTPEEAKIKEYEITQKKDFVAKLKTIKAKGRVSIAINQPEILRETTYDIDLTDGDSLFIPSNPESVQVIGSVYNQTAFVYDKDKSSSADYIDLAGGYTEGADKKRVYILKVDGTATRPGGGFLGISWSKDSNGWELGSQDIEPGDTIVVPEKLEKIAWMRNIKDITQILYQIAVTAGVTIALY